MTKTHFQNLPKFQYLIATVVIVLTGCLLGLLVKLLWREPQTLPVLSDYKPSTVSRTATEIVEKRTLTSKTFDNHDGTYSSVFTPGPQFYKDDSGRLNEISAVINQSSNDPEYQLANLSNTFKTHIAIKSDQKYLIKIEKDGASIELGPEPIPGQDGPHSVFGIAKDNTITYPNIYEGIDLRYRITKTRFATEYIVKNRQAGEKINALSQNVKLNQLSLEKVASGGLELKHSGDNLGEDETVWAEIGSPIVYEEKNPEISTSVGISYAISRHSTEEVTLTKNLGPEINGWLAKDDRQYPVVIDPDLIVYPDAGDPGSTTIDGHVRRSSVDQAFADIRTATGIANGSTAAQENILQLTASSTSDQFSVMRRYIWLFNTASISASDSISSVTLSIYGTAKANGLGSPDLDIVSSSPASNTTLANADYLYTNFGTTVYGSVSYANFSTTGYNDITLTTDAVTKEGITKLGARNSWDTDGSFTGTWVTGDASSMQAYSADQTDTTSDPKLTVTYTPNVLTNLEGVSIEGVNIN